MTALDQQSPSASSAGGFLRELDNSDFDALHELLSRDADAYCVLIERIITHGLTAVTSGGRTYGWFEDDVMLSAIFVGANTSPAFASPASVTAYGRFLSRRNRISSAIVGYRDDVLPLWESIEPTWGACRELRSEQPLLVIDSEPQLDRVAGVRKGTLLDLDGLMGPSVDMFTEEVGVSPVAGGRGPAFRARVASSVLEGRTYLLADDDDKVVFKAEVGAVAAGSAQIQGVWLAPELRGKGLSAPVLAEMIRHVQHDHAPRVSLYVNAHNEPALRTYARVGFRQVGTFATVLF